MRSRKSDANRCKNQRARASGGRTTTGVGEDRPGSSRRAGTTRRSDGTTEVTYHGHPLYYYAGDSRPGEVAGQSLNQFGGGTCLRPTARYTSDAR